jgi:hypothetical protein
MDFTKCFDKLEPLSIYNFWKRLLSALGDSRLINLETTADRNSQILFVLTLAFLICVTTDYWNCLILSLVRACARLPIYYHTT